MATRLFVMFYTCFYHFVRLFYLLANSLKILNGNGSYCSAKADNFTTKCAQLIGKCFRDLETVSLGGLIVDVTAMVFIGKTFFTRIPVKITSVSAK